MMRGSPYAVGLLCLLVVARLAAGEATALPLAQRLGLNGHFKFKPELYAPVCNLARNYHNIGWDVQRPGDAITLPVAVNKVRWGKHVYDPWAAAGFEVDICLTFGRLGPQHADFPALWQGQADWCRAYGRELARQFGPTHGSGVCTSIEIGNEPGEPFDDALFRTVVMAMAAGIRDGDPAVRICTPTVHVAPANKYAKDLRVSFADARILPLYDVINLHTYAQVPRRKGISPWTRSYPEDPAIAYLDAVDAAIAWRDGNAPEKAVWVTEFGYDACTPEAMSQRTGWAEKLDWRGVSDLQQAQYLVRSVLAFARRPVERAYIYYFNDADQPSVHAAAGLTRHYRPKPAYHALVQFSALLGGCRFDRAVVERSGELCVYAFADLRDPQRQVWVAWSPTGTRTDRRDSHEPREADVRLDALPAVPARVVGMATGAGDAPEPAWRAAGAAAITLRVGESPCYIVFE